MELSSHHSLSQKPNPDDDDDDNDTLSTPQLTPEPTSKKRKVLLQKTVVSVKIGSKKAAIKIGKLKNEGPPPDFWSWRKYGQKPIKGSPYPRGYYRCSTTKGCSAKKQVERCKTDGSMFIITYTSSHNHPGPNISTLNLDQNQEEIQQQPSDQDQLAPNQGLEKQDQDHNDEKNSIIPSDYEEEEEEEECSSLALEKEKKKEPLECLDLEEEPISSCSSQKFINLSATKKSELENHHYDHFFDELEELPISPPFSSLMRSSYFFDEVIRIPPAPS